MQRVLLAWWLLAASASAQLALARWPADGQLYPRDVATNATEVAVAGAVTVPGVARVHLRVTQDGVPWWSDSADLAYAGGWAPFLFAAPLEAGLHDYGFVLELERAGGVSVAREADFVACGDAYLINGQSNAVASDYHGEGLGNDSQSRWIRSFGTASTEPAAVAADDRWYLADGIDANGPGTVGAWGLRAAELLVLRYGVPVAVLNGSQGGTPLFQHQRDALDPDNLDTIYGRLLHRVRRAGLARNVRAMLWHQGEASGLVNPHTYTDSFNQLRRSWLEDYPALEHVFVFQIRKGCGVDGMGLREAQRRFQDLMPNLTCVPTAGIDEHDACHFGYGGYRRMGEWIAAEMGEVLYGEALPRHAPAPNLLEARFLGAARDTIELRFRIPDQPLHLDPGIEDRFRLRGGVSETVVSASTTPGRILLQLSGPTAATGVAYIGQKRSGPWIKNGFGVGAFTFDVPLER